LKLLTLLLITLLPAKFSPLHKFIAVLNIAVALYMLPLILVKLVLVHLQGFIASYQEFFS
jgi:hypothetical protein